MALGPCEEAWCDGGVCRPRAMAEGATCRAAACDGTAFVPRGTCLKGLCLKTQPVPCDDAEPCTSDGCDPLDGCQHAPGPGPCDDGSPCTTGDHCQGGACVYSAKVCDCALDADCAADEDGDLCNGTLICNQISGECEVDTSTIVTCSTVGDTPCLKSTCQPATGFCKQKALVDGTACDDGVDCTHDDECKSGVCIGVKDCG